MPTREITYMFLDAFSFAGEQRELVRSIAEAVEERLGRGTVFLAEWFEYYIAGSDADTRLQEIYGQKAELVIVSVSANYGGKSWTLAEHQAIRSRQMQLGVSNDKKDAFRILPVRTGEGDVKGILFTAICPDVRQRPVAQTAELIVNRLRLIVPDAKPTPATPSRFVYLAECTPDMDDRRTDEGIPRRTRVDGASRQRVSGGRISIRAREGPEGIARLRATARTLPMEEGRIRPHPERRRVGARHPAVSLSQLGDRSGESGHKTARVLSAPEIIATGFQDLKAHLEKELAVLAQRRNAAAKGRRRRYSSARSRRDPLC